MAWHVTPRNDLKDHVRDGGKCWCKPIHDLTNDGEDLWIHNSMDGRELYERGERKPT